MKSLPLGGEENRRSKGRQVSAINKMNFLLPDNSDEFLDRFYSFGDALLRHVEVDYRLRSNPHRKATIVLSCQDRQSSGNKGWINLSLHLEDVTEFQFAEPPQTTFVVISDYVHIAWFQDVAFLDFGGLTDEPKAIEDFRKSPVYVAAKV